MPKIPHDECPVLIGQAPSRILEITGDRVFQPLTNTWAPHAFSGPGRLVRMIGTDRETFLAKAETLNLLDAFPGRKPDGKGDLWNAAAARRRAAQLIPSLKGRTVVTFGRLVAEAFDFMNISWLCCTVRNGVTWHLLPHPSAVNVWWNKSWHRKAAILLLRKLLGLPATEGW